MHITMPPGPYEAAWESLSRYRVPEWYLDAKFGIFIHWGVYAVPAHSNEWYPRNMYLQKEADYAYHLQTFGPHKQFGYKDFIPQFRAEQWDPDAWAELFRRSGARYIVPVAEHHDGFQLYDSALSEWNSVKMGPKRDIIGELSTSLERVGLTLGLSSHRAEHWWFFGGGREFDSDVQDPAYAGFYGPAASEGTQPDEAFLEDWLARTCEFVDKFRPQLVWFDWWIEQPAFQPYLRRFAAYYYNRAAEWGVGVAINYKNEAFPVTAAVYDIERGQLNDLRFPYWQTDTSVSKNSWGYVSEQQYKSLSSLIHDLIDIVSKNGCLLLNIGPRPDGTIPEEEQQLLLGIGSWLETNGEAIYGTRAWKVYGEGPTEVVAGSFHDTERQEFTAEDVRYTIKGESLYAILCGWPENSSFLLRTLGSTLRLWSHRVGKVSLLGSSEPVLWEQTPAGLSGRLPARPDQSCAFTLKIEPAL